MQRASSVFSAICRREPTHALAWGGFLHSLLRILIRVINHTQEFTSFEISTETTAAGRKFKFSSLYAVAFRPRTYLRIFYLLISLPMGMFLAAFTLTALSVGIALVPVGIGVVVLGALAAGSWILFGIEREVAILLLRTDIRPIVPPRAKSDNNLSIIKAYMRSPRTWFIVLYLIGRFPIGAISFAITVSALGLASMLTAAPILINLGDIDLGIWLVEELWEALLLSLIGPPTAILALHLVNALAMAHSRLINLLIEPERLPTTPE